MNIVYLIGNGFDINLGLKTRYVDFYNHYLDILHDDPLIEEAKRSIKIYLQKVKAKRKLNMDEVNWADLELALGEYTENFQNKREFDKVFRDIAKELSLYLQGEEQKYVITNEKKGALKSCFCNPFNDYLSEVDVRSILQTYKNLREVWRTYIISFNYTTTLEKLLGWNNERMNTGTHIEASSVWIDGVQHIHGYTNRRMVMGVNDESQIKNKTLLSNQYFRNSIIKKECNVAQATLHVQQCSDYIRHAQMFFMFGLSIGDTDKDWWNLIANTMYTNGAPLIIYVRSDRDVTGIFSFDRQEVIDETKELFLSKLSIDEEKKQAIRERIYVAINSNMFNVEPDNQSVAG